MSETVPQFSPPFFDFKYAKSVPHDWNWISLSDVVEPKQWHNLSQSSFLERGFPVYGANGQIGFYSEYNHEKPVIAVSCRGACGDIHLTKPFSYVTSNAMCLDNISDEVDEKFLYFGLIYRTLQDTISGSAQPQITGQSLQKVKFPAPPLPEQKKIASILTSVDEVIETTQKQIDKLQDLKKATMNELLTKGIGHTEFKDSELGRIPKSWEVATLGTYFALTSGKSKPTRLLSPKRTKDNSIPVYGGNGVNGYTDSPLLEKPTIVVGRVGEYCGCVALTPQLAWITDNALYVKTILKPCNMQFLFNLLTLTDLSKLRSKGGQPLVSQQPIHDHVVAMPALEEQEEIASVLSAIDVRITIQEQKLSQTQSLKKSLMQDLLTGKVRVQVN